MLFKNKQVFAAGEDTALAPLTTAINSALASSAPSEHPAMLERFAEQYLTAMQAKVPASWSEATSTATATSLSRPSKPSRIVDKMLRNLWLVGYIHMLLPKSCIVHVVRHPMDVAMSCYAQPFGYSASALAWSWDLAAIASQLQMTWDLAEHWEEQLPGRVHTGVRCWLCSGWRAALRAPHGVFVLQPEDLLKLGHLTHLHSRPTPAPHPFGLAA